MREHGAARRRGMPHPPAFIERCNWDRPHSACGGLPPMSRIGDVSNALAYNS